MKRIFFFDMDGTILPNTTGLLQAAKHFKNDTELYSLEEKFKNKLITTTEFTYAIAKLWGPIPNNISKKIFKKSPKIGGLKKCLERIKENGDYSCLITLSQDFFAEHFLDYGIDYVFSTKYPPHSTEGKDSKCLSAEDKAMLAIDLCHRLNICITDCVAFGDSSGDLPLFKVVGYSIAVNPSKDLSQYVSTTYKGNSILKAYNNMKKYIQSIESKMIISQRKSTTVLNPGRNIIASAFENCIKNLYNTSTREFDFKDLWLKKIRINKNLTPNGWYSPPENGMAVLFSNDTNTKRSHFSSYRDSEFFSSDVTINWKKGIITGYASNIDRDNNLPGDFGTTVYLGDDLEITNYIKQCISISETLFSLLKKSIIKTSAELYNAAIKLFDKYHLEGISYSSTLKLWNLGHTLHTLNSMDKYSTERNFISNEKDWELNSGIMFTYEPQYRSITNPAYPKLMHHYVLQYVNEKFEICRKCVNNISIQNGIWKHKLAARSQKEES